MYKSESIEKGLTKRVKNSHKRTVTPFGKLKKRLLKEFQRKKFIGDIIINESEYEIIIDYFKAKCNGLIKSNLHSINDDPLFAIALVQIGIKYYDGNFWSHVAAVLGIEKVNAIHQGIIGVSFTNTLSSNNKVMLNKSERVNNILMHGFVSDHFANEMFEFLFKYYNIDLERDLLRNNTEMLNSLIEVIQRDDDTGRTYLLVKQTANAISVNSRGGKIRIRRLLKLIDKCFWEQIVPVNPVNRLSKLFINWQESSSEFKMQYNKYHICNIGGGKKSYSAPYIKCDFRNTAFKLVLPTQLIKFEYENDVKWNIYNNEQEKTIGASLYQAVTGNKTETVEINIKNEEIFNEFVIELAHNNNRIKLFKIKADCIRFFDRDGDFLNSDSSLPKGEVYSFTKDYEIPISDALIENEPVGSLIRSYFEFEYGDIVRLPDGKPLSIGKKLEEGLLARKALNFAYSMYNNFNIPIYSAPPAILLKIAAKRANGTVIEINGNRYHLFDNETTIIELGDRSGETGYIINLGNYGCTEDGIYSIFVDVPNDRTNRQWLFALINGISYEFDDAPYIFKSKGTIRFNEGLIVNTKLESIIKNSDENSFNFEIQPDVDYLPFDYNSKNIAINLYFDVPVLKWKFGEEKWHIEQPIDIWHSDFPAMIYLKYPDDKIRLSMEEQIDFGNNLDEQAATYLKSKSKGIFECDTTRFKSWFSRDKVIRSVFIDFQKNRTEFVKVITQSTIVSHILKGDFESSKLIGEFEILGKSNYFVDVMLLDTRDKLAQKLPIIDGKFSIDTTLGSGLYKINVYEDEEDDTGFGITNYLTIGEFKHNLINPYDLHGKSISIKYIKEIESNMFSMHLNCKYIVSNLKRVDESDKHNYTGILMIKDFYGNRPIAYDVNINFSDLNKLQNARITYYDGYDFIEFLYDTNRKIIVKKEEEGLSRAVRYRRYESLYSDEYVYIIEFNEEIQKIIQPASILSMRPIGNHIECKHENSNNMSIEQMGLSIGTYNCLRKAKIQTAKDIERLGTSSLNKLIELGYEGINEIVLKMREIGFIMEDIKPIENQVIELLTDNQLIQFKAEKFLENKELISVQENHKEIDTLDTCLSEIGLSMLALNCLKNANVLTVRDITEKGVKKLGNIHGFNKNMCKEVIYKLHSIGVSVE